MEIADELAQVQEAVDAAERQLVTLQAELQGLRAKRNSLEAANRSTTRSEHSARSLSAELAELTQIDAIIRILQVGDRPMTIGEVRQGLLEGGRPKADYAPIAASLSMLVANGRVERPTRGRYRA